MNTFNHITPFGAPLALQWDITAEKANSDGFFGSLGIGESGYIEADVADVGLGTGQKCGSQGINFVRSGPSYLSPTQPLLPSGNTGTRSGSLPLVAPARYSSTLEDTDKHSRSHHFLQHEVISLIKVIFAGDPDGDRSFESRLMQI